MNATTWKAIALFVEGFEDEMFMTRIFRPRLETQYSHVYIHQYAQRSSEQIRAHTRSLAKLAEKGHLFFLFADSEQGRCIRKVRQEIAEHYEIPESQVLVVRPEIEAWYCAGVPDSNKFKVQLPPTVDDISKEAFARLFGKRAQGSERKLLLSEVLDVYDWDLALQRSSSLRYCALKLGI